VSFNSFFSFLSVLFIGFSSAAFGAEPKQAVYVPGQIVLKVQPVISLEMKNGQVSTNNGSLQAVLNQIGAKTVNAVFPWDNGGTRLSQLYTLQIDSQADVPTAVEKLWKVDGVISAQPNYVIKPFMVPTDVSFSMQWALQKVNSTMAWDLFTGNEKVIVAVIDSGVDLDHNDLKANIWTNPNEIPNNGIDDDQNGYVDDVHGWDFCSPYPYDNKPMYRDPNDPNSVDSYSVIHPEDNNPGNDPLDPIDEHGTHVAGIIGAVANNTVGGTTNICGVLWNCQIMPLRAGCIITHGIVVDDFSSVDLAQAIRYAADNGAQVINMSLGGWYLDSIEDDAIQYAYSKGVVVCAAAGNSSANEKMYPACCNHVLSVVATDENDKKADFSTYGEWFDIAAPGVGILSCLLNNSYGNMSGTSMACPMVAGAAGMVVGYGNSIGKKFAPGQVEYILKQSADNIDDLNPDYPDMCSSGRLNVSAALFMAQTTPPMISLIEIKSVDQPDATEIKVKELTSHKFKAIAVHTDGSTTDVTDQVEWSMRPSQYGQFSVVTKGQLNVSQVPADREVVILASINDNETFITGDRVITIQYDPQAAPLAIEGPEQVNPQSKNQYKAVFQMPDGKKVDITDTSVWDMASGGEYAKTDLAQPGMLLVTGNAGGQEVTLRATYTDPSDRRTYQQTKKIVVRNVAQQVSALFLTAPSQLAAGSNNQLLAQLFYAGQNVSEDVSTLSTWSVSPAEAGSFVQPGLFLAGQVTATTTATLTVQYVSNGQVYTASVDTKIIPAVAQGITIQKTEDETNELDAETQSIFQTMCPTLAVMIFGALFVAGFWLSRQD